MFSWKKQNPPSQQRQQQRQAPQGTPDYSDLIAQGMRLANEDINEDDDMGDINDEDLGDIDLDDPELLAELQGLTGEAPAPKPKPAAAPSRPVVKAPAPVQTTKPVAAAPPKPAPVAKAPPAKISSPVQLPNKPSPSTTPAVPPSLAGLGLDLEGAMDDNDDEEVELTEDDWKDPHLLAQLQLLGGHTEHHDEEPQKTTETPAKTVSSPKAGSPVSKPLTQTTPIPSESGPLSPAGTHSFREQRPVSTSSSMIAIPPKDQAFGDEEDIDGDSFMAEQQQEETRHVDESSAPSPVKAKPQKRVEEIPKKNDKNLLELLKTRDMQYKKAAIEAKNAGNMPLATERAKVFKALQSWIRLVEAGGFLDLELYPIPDEPPALASNVKNDVDVAGATPAAPSARPKDTEAKTSAHPAMTPTSDMITQDSIAEASAEDMRNGSNLRGALGGGFEIKQLAADDDFQIVSNSNDDTYDMLQSQLESQINMCQTAYKHYYYQSGDLQTAVKFRSLQKTFMADLESLQSHRSHGKKAPAFHFQDVRFELEVGFYQEIGLNDLSLNIVRAWDLSHKDVQPSDIEAYVLWDLGWPMENMAGAGSGKGSTPTAKRSSKPDFNFSKTLGIQRGMAFQRFAEKKKITFEVWHYRGLLWKDYFLGRAQLPLAALLNHSEIHEIVPLMDTSNRRSTGAKIEIQIRLQQPLLRREIVVKEEKWLVIDEFNSGGLGFPTPALSAPGSRPAGGTSKARTPAGRATKAAATPASPVGRAPNSPAPARPIAPASKPAPPKQAATTTSTSTTPASPARDNRPASATPKTSTSAPKTSAPAPVAKAPVPIPAAAAAAAGDLEESESERALSELNNVDLLVSNMVLESEIQQAKQMIHDARAVANSEAAEEYQDRLTQLEIKMKLLVIRVQTGQLTMDGYCQSVNERIAKDRALAVEFKRIGMIPEAKKALARSKIMAQEMKEVEEAMAAQREAGDE
ncbi:Coiled-coil and C2 domain-containing protein 1B [Mortierella sp. AD094]|nr:Coiled-coil and C2 domain-containing protein 1B [Mortierella sp. AD094]